MDVVYACAWSLDGGVERVVAPVVHGGEVDAVLQQHGADRGQVVLGRDVQGGLTKNGQYSVTNPYIMLIERYTIVVEYEHT